MRGVSFVLFVILVILGLILFIPVWLNAFIAPIHIGLHALLTFGLLKLKYFRSSLKPTLFAIWACFAPFALLLVQAVASLPLNIVAKSNIWGILLITGLTGVICAIEFLIARRLYSHWLARQHIA